MQDPPAQERVNQKAKGNQDQRLPMLDLIDLQAQATEPHPYAFAAEEGVT